MVLFVYTDSQRSAYSQSSSTRVRRCAWETKHLGRAARTGSVHAILCWNMGVRAGERVRATNLEYESESRSVIPA